jgi:hypothetical protein
MGFREGFEMGVDRVVKKRRGRRGARSQGEHNPLPPYKLTPY